jgi:hypothetical protein
VKEGYVLKADAAKYLTPEPITYAAMKRKSEKAAQNALEDARASVMRAAGIGRVETYCINTVLAELKREGLSPEQEEYKRISRETARMVIRDRKGLWTRYYTDKEGLKDWILWKLGLKKEMVFDRMKRMGITGDVLQDMELLTGGKKEMKTKELIEYLQEFDAESEVVVIAANPKERKKYDGEMFGITDGGQPIFCIEISNESDLDEKEIAAAVQDEREEKQR